MKNIVIFASGGGSNAQKIIDHFNTAQRSDARVVLVICNKKEAGVLKIAERANIPAALITRDDFYSAQSCVDLLRSYKADLVALAGFLWKIPDAMIKAFPRRIINIHPALLPSFGGKGMYGKHVHEAVLKAGKKFSGITIHYVDGHYDNGDIIFQEKCPVESADDADDLAKRVLTLEHKHYPRVIEKIIAEL